MIWMKTSSRLNFFIWLIRMIKKVPAAKLMLIAALFAIAFNPAVSQAKDSDNQSQIILLNDSAAAIEDSNPELSKSLTQFADEKEKEWNAKNANKDAPSAIFDDKNSTKFQEQLKLLNSAAIAIQPTYPLMAQALTKMAKGMDRIIEIEK